VSVTSPAETDAVSLPMRARRDRCLMRERGGPQREENP
jgi:hypothetical protein